MQLCIAPARFSFPWQCGCVCLEIASRLHTSKMQVVHVVLIRVTPTLRWEYTYSLYSATKTVSWWHGVETRVARVSDSGVLPKRATAAHCPACQRVLTTLNVARRSIHNLPLSNKFRTHSAIMCTLALKDTVLEMTWCTSQKAQTKAKRSSSLASYELSYTGTYSYVLDPRHFYW